MKNASILVRTTWKKQWLSSALTFEVFLLQMRRNDLDCTHCVLYLFRDSPCCVILEVICTSSMFSKANLLNW
jgi:hypothetical protein